MAGTVTRKVSGIDRIAWVQPSKHTKNGYEHRSAARGEVVDLPEDQADRLADYLVDADAQVEEPEAAWSPVLDDVLEGMTVEQVTAYLQAAPEEARDDELDRVLSAENARERPRVGVLSLDPDFEPDPDDTAADPTG